MIDLTTGNFGYGFSDDYKQGYSDGRASIIEELEKIKAEIKELDVEPNGITFWRTYRHESVNDFLQILDNHIKELKGENNEKKEN